MTEDRSQKWTWEEGDLIVEHPCKRCGLTYQSLDENKLCSVCAQTLIRGYEISTLVASSEKERELYHARMLHDNKDRDPHWQAVCGIQPDRRSEGWLSDLPDDREVTCKECLDQLLKSSLT